MCKYEYKCRIKCIKHNILVTNMKTQSICYYYIAFGLNWRALYTANRLQTANLNPLVR